MGSNWLQHCCHLPGSNNYCDHHGNTYNMPFLNVFSTSIISSTPWVLDSLIASMIACIYPLISNQTEIKLAKNAYICMFILTITLKAHFEQSFPIKLHGNGERANNKQLPLLSCPVSSMWSPKKDLLQFFKDSTLQPPGELFIVDFWNHDNVCIALSWEILHMIANKLNAF